MNNARFPYTYKAVQYTAKPSAGDGPCQCHCWLYLVFNHGNKTTSEFERKKCFNRSSNIEAANWLLEQNITTLGTVQKNRVGIPTEVFDSKNCKVFSKT